MDQKIYCVECGDQDADLICKQCDDVYCEVCFQSLHRRGNRFKHVTEFLPGKKSQRVQPASADYITQEGVIVNGDLLEPELDGPQKMDVVDPEQVGAELEITESPKAGIPGVSAAIEPLLGGAVAEVPLSAYHVPVPNPTPEWFSERCAWIPLRLNALERQHLALVDSAMDVSEYTDDVDVYSHRSKITRVQRSMSDACCILTGLKLCADYKSGKEAVLSAKSIIKLGPLIAEIFESGRRHKIRNPDKLRTSYGKLIHLLQDSVDASNKISLKLVSPIRTVGALLEERAAEDVLRHPLLPVATSDVATENKTREEIDAAAAYKRYAIQKIIQDCTSAAGNGERKGLAEEEVKLVLDSIYDNHSFLQSNRGPVDRMLEYLEEYFHPMHPKADISIRAGKRGSCLSHDHKTQFVFVKQSLHLWQNILHDMFRLWILAEQDLLDPRSGYRLRNTGQGLQRMQNCPRISRAMSQIVNATHHQMKGRWVGLSVVHLGDRDVPNALVFIDKYNQVSRILSPVVTCIQELPELYRKDVGAKKFIDRHWGGVEEVRTAILQDFFRHGFDGSGDDGGSCIDGRLTSCWNWCSKIAKKSYYPIFQMTGFIGFDGEF